MLIGEVLADTAERSGARTVDFCIVYSILWTCNNRNDQKVLSNRNASCMFGNILELVGSYSCVRSVIPGKGGKNTDCTVPLRLRIVFHDRLMFFFWQNDNMGTDEN